MVSKSVDYAVRALVFMAKSKDGGYFGVREISEAVQAPFSYLGKVLQKLTHAGILNSSTGPRGGFCLKRSPNKITLLQLIHSLDGESIEHNCFLGFDSCSNKNPCPIHPTWEKMRPQIIRTLGKITIQEAAKRSWPSFH